MVQLVFALEELDVHGMERRLKIFAPLGAKSGSGTNAEAGKDGSAPTELRTKERITSYSLCSWQTSTAKSVSPEYLCCNANI